MTTKEDIAARINGREYGSEMDKDTERLAKEAGLVIVFGYSDDIIEAHGAIYDEAGAYDGGQFLVIGNSIIRGERHRCDCGFCGYAEAAKNAITITAEWSKNGYAWFISASVPFATFDIVEDGEKFCRGIVFPLKQEASK